MYCSGGGGGGGGGGLWCGRPFEEPHTPKPLKPLKPKGLWRRLTRYIRLNTK